MCEWSVYEIYDFLRVARSPGVPLGDLLVQKGNLIQIVRDCQCLGLNLIADSRSSLSSTRA